MIDCNYQFIDYVFFIFPFLFLCSKFTQPTDNADMDCSILLIEV